MILNPPKQGHCNPFYKGFPTVYMCDLVSQVFETIDRVTTLKSEDMQNQSTLAFSIRSTLGKIETTLQIGEALEKLCEKCNIKS